MKNEQKKINRFSHLADRAVSDEELEKVSGGNPPSDLPGVTPPMCSICGMVLNTNGVCLKCSRLRT